MDETGKPRITKEFLKRLLKDRENYYTTPELNDILYLHYKGFEKIENLEEFKKLKVLYLEGNCITTIEGLDELKELRCLFLQENMINKISGLENLTDLRTINLTSNFIEKIEGLSQCTMLDTLLLKQNRIGKNGLDDLKGVLEIPSLRVLDIQDNKIEDENIISEIFEKMPKLSVLYCQNNPFCKKIPSYRKTIIARLPKLAFLDDRPIFPEDRCFAEAWYKGGLEAEREARAKWKQEQEEKNNRYHVAFKEMIERHKRMMQEARENQSVRNSSELNVSIDSERSNEDQTITNSTSTSKLETYNSEGPGTPNSSKSFNMSDIKNSNSEIGNSDSKENSQLNSEAESDSEPEKNNNRESSVSTNFDELE